VAGDSDRDLQLGGGTPSKPESATGSVQEDGVGSRGARGRARGGMVRSGDTCFRGFIGWTTDVARLPGMESNRMGSKSRGQEGWRAKGELDSVSGCAGQRWWAGVRQGTQGRRNGSRAGEGRRTS